MNLAKSALLALAAASILQFPLLPAQAEEIPAEKHSTIVLNRRDSKNEHYEAAKLMFITSQDSADKLLFSDSPETVDSDGILYEDTVKGDARLLYYHLNNMKDDKKVAVVIENMSDKPSRLTITRKATGGPSEDYLYVGKTTLMRYLGDEEHREMTLAPNARTILYKPDDERTVPYGGLVYGIFDFNAQRDLKVSVIIAPKDANLLSYAAHAPILPKDVHRLRGTYDGKDRYLTNRSPFNLQRTGPVYFYIGDNRTDLYKYGFDATDNSATQNFGNYGIMYTFHPRLNGKGSVSYYLKPIGGVYAGAMTVRIGKNGQRRVIPTPEGLPFFGHEKDLNYYSYLGTYSSQDDIYFEYTPPGASNLPVQILMLPEPEHR